MSLAEFYQNPLPELTIDDYFFLREQITADATEFLSYYKHPDVCRYILAEIPSSLPEATEEIEYCRNLFYQQRGAYWTIAQKKDNRIIGAIGLYINNQHQRCEICYDLNKLYWRQGIMTRALKTIIDFVFNGIELHRIEALTIKENIASIDILTKLGFEREGALKNYRYFKGKPFDVEILGVTPTMFYHHQKASLQ